MSQVLRHHPQLCVSERFVNGLKAAGVEFFAGVPDSQLKGFCAYVTDMCGENHAIAVNEGGTGG